MKSHTYPWANLLILFNWNQCSMYKKGSADFFIFFLKWKPQDEMTYIPKTSQEQKCPVVLLLSALTLQHIQNRSMDLDSNIFHLFWPMRDFHAFWGWIESKQQGSVLVVWIVSYFPGVCWYTWGGSRPQHSCFETGRRRELEVFSKDLGQYKGPLSSGVPLLVKLFPLYSHW